MNLFSFLSNSRRKIFQAAKHYRFITIYRCEYYFRSGILHGNGWIRLEYGFLQWYWNMCLILRFLRISNGSDFTSLLPLQINFPKPIFLFLFSKFHKYIWLRTISSVSFQSTTVTPKSSTECSLNIFFC